jgi:hypothetical protein
MRDGAMVRIGESVRLCHRYAVKPAQKRTKCVNPGVYLSAAHHRVRRSESECSKGRERERAFKGRESTIRSECSKRASGESESESSKEREH